MSTFSIPKLLATFYYYCTIYHEPNKSSASPSSLFLKSMNSGRRIYSDPVRGFGRKFLNILVLSPATDNAGHAAAKSSIIPAVQHK